MKKWFLFAVLMIASCACDNVDKAAIDHLAHHYYGVRVHEIGEFKSMPFPMHILDSLMYEVQTIESKFDNISAVEKNYSGYKKVLNDLSAILRKTNEIDAKLDKLDPIIFNPTVATSSVSCERKKARVAVTDKVQLSRRETMNNYTSPDKASCNMVLFYDSEGKTVQYCTIELANLWGDIRKRNGILKFDVVHKQEFFQRRIDNIVKEFNDGF